jgi:hypothetical protein
MKRLASIIGLALCAFMLPSKSEAYVRFGIGIGGWGWGGGEATTVPTMRLTTATTGPTATTVLTTVTTATRAIGPIGATGAGWRVAGVVDGDLAIRQASPSS